MKLIGELKKKVENLETTEEIRQAIADAGMELTDEEMENVDGGGSRTQSPTTTTHYCENCGSLRRGEYEGRDGVIYCKKCNIPVSDKKGGMFR